jgi:DNA repair protein RecN (Recombination protein N)
MLRELHIENYALISRLDIRFEQGFSVLTGETGAGKSIILGALNLLTGGKADPRSITEGEQRCVIEAIFTTSDAEDAAETIVRRELHRNGRSRSFVNDEPVTQADLKALAEQLTDIHSQHDNLLLGHEDFQLNTVDTVAGNQSERATYTTRYQAWQESVQALHDLEEKAARCRKEEDYIAFQYKQLEEAQLTSPDEKEELETEEYRLSHVEQLQIQLQTALQALDGEDGGAIHLVRSAKDALDHGDSLRERLGSTEIELKDIAAEINRLAESTEADPARLQQVQERIALLQSLMRKHEVQTLQELITLRDQLGEQLAHLGSFDAEINQLRQEADARHESMRQAAEKLTATRQAVLAPIADQLTRDLAALGIAHAHVKIELTPQEAYTENGHDHAELLFAANLNQPLRRVSEVASGGETSRLMLCIKAMTAASHGQQTLIFDEIDTGVSGAVAARMGQIMQQTGQTRQVIAITHLPQIAACADHQYKVYKQDTESRTETHIRPLDEQDRIDEIAAMLAGNHVTGASKETARQLIESSKKHN